MSFFNKLFAKGTKPNESQDIPKYIIDLNTKYFRNLDLMVDYDISIDCFCDISETWNEKPLESNITYLETHKIVKQILENEYCEEICDKIKEGNFTEEEANDFIIKLDNQYLLYRKQCDYTKELEDDLLDKFQKGEIK